MMPNPKQIQTINGVEDEDTEISIFDAQRYFNETNTTDARLCKRISPVKDPLSSELRCDIPASTLAGRFSAAADGYGYGTSHRARSFHATPTASSEASWNSQTVSFRLRTPCDCFGNRKTADDKRRLQWYYCRRFHVSATARRPMISDGSNGTTAVGFTFPILNQHDRNPNSLDDHNDPPRASLEVFRPADDVVGSDTSSDLFEIESFSASNPPYHRRDSLDEASNFNIIRSIGASGNVSGFSCTYSPMTAECYEPSEASIEWSVTTAEGFERGLEAEEMMNMNMRVGNGGGGGRKRSGLLSCRCEKAVNVGPNPVKYVPPHGQAAASSKHVANVNKPPLAPLSLPFGA
ncbi:Detected protein of unknown function [Hibiscus syriacus]|uniref:Uncharacterized protein n=1 Tax=Hibiscus syriacus TaxID=106335 RepID=A0A6A3CHK1_HIBSY|nr:Detected protein of unknown function [Hibiscus syriacus]